MEIDRILWFLAAVSFFIGALVGMGAAPERHTVLNRVNWMLAGFGFIALTFVF